MVDTGRKWFEIDNLDEVESPALLIYPERVEENIRRMISIAGDPARLRPHVKTHKLAQIADLQLKAGITRFKAATIAEAEMLGRLGVPDVLLAYQPVGPNARRFLDLQAAFPGTLFSCLLDDLASARTLSELAAQRRMKVRVLLDVDCGQHRTGVPPDERAVQLYRVLCEQPGLSPAGLHAYDGHLHVSDAGQRRRECDAAFANVANLGAQLRELGLPAQTVVAGGTPTFPFHAARREVECSPGTCVLWDFGYSSGMADLDFLHSALVLTRVISKPGTNRLCLDLGHKAIAAEKPQPRVHFLNEPSARPVAHSEEHLVVETEAAPAWKVGDCLLGVPWHICPTVALYREAVVIRGHVAGERWAIESRDRHLQF